MVFKPLDGNHGKGATINVKTEEEAVEALIMPKNIQVKLLWNDLLPDRFSGFGYRP